MSKLLYITNIGGKRMAYGFSGTAIEAADTLNMDFYSVANRSQATTEDIKEDEEKYHIKLLHSDIARSPFSFYKNYLAYKQIVKIIRENEIDYIHCNTPVGGILGRLAGKKCKVKKVIYQVHGFHFYKGAPLLNKLIYYPIEKWLARKTDAIITINSEDYMAAQKFKLRKNGKVYYVPGVGIDTSSFFKEQDIDGEIRQELGIARSDIMLISAGELNQNKNNKVILNAMAKAPTNVHYVLCGVGPLEDELKALAKKLAIEKRVHFLGYRNDIKTLYSQADVYVMPSYREGLSRSLMEAMSSGLPCIVSKIRGNTDLIDEGNGGFLCSPNDTESFAKAITSVANNAELRARMREYNIEKIKKFDVSVVESEMKRIYEEVLLKN